jgi:glycosyltransferase involved in cell wall biosynthesis
VLRLPVSRNPGILRILAEHFYIPALARRAEAAFSLDYLLPLLPLRARRTVVTVHDILPLQQKPAGYPVEASALRHRYYCLAIEHALKAADTVIADSRYVASTIADLFPSAAKRTAVVPLGIDHDRFCPGGGCERIRMVREAYGLPREFYLFVGRLCLNKNLRIIAEAYASGYLPGRLKLPVVVVGADRNGNKGNPTLKRIECLGVGKYFHLVGYLPDTDLPAVYAAAQALIHPAWHEGFGFPPLEAMACGTPVVASNQTAVPEVVGDAAVLVDPGSPRSLARALECVNDPKRRSEMIGRGIQRAARFTWERTAEMTASAVCGQCSNDAVA